MPIEVNGKKLYSSAEVAQIFDISVSTVRTWRLNNRLKGTRIGTATYHTQEQIDAARTEPKTRGPKPKVKRGEDSGSGGTKPSVVLSTLCAASPSYDAYFTRVG